MERRGHEGVPAQPGSASLDTAAPLASGSVPGRAAGYSEAVLPHGEGTRACVPGPPATGWLAGWAFALSAASWGQWKNLHPNEMLDQIQGARRKLNVRSTANTF